MDLRDRNSETGRKRKIREKKVKDMIIDVI